MILSFKNDPTAQISFFCEWAGSVIYIWEGGNVSPKFSPKFAKKILAKTFECKKWRLWDKFFFLCGNNLIPRRKKPFEIQWRFQKIILLTLCNVVFFFFIFFWKKLNSRNVYNWQLFAILEMCITSRFLKQNKHPQKFFSPAASEARKNILVMYNWRFVVGEKYLPPSRNKYR